MRDAAHTLLTQIVPVPPQGGYKPAKFGYDVIYNQQKNVDGRQYAFDWMYEHGFLGPAERLKEAWVDLLH